MILKAQWNRFLRYIARGMSITDACTIARINRISVYRRRDKDPKFAKDMDAALIVTKARAVRLVRKAMATQWQAGAWWLERKSPDEFSLKSQPLINLTFKPNEKLKDIDNEKLIEVVIDNQIEYDKK
jgi:hypothetical protein